MKDGDRIVAVADDDELKQVLKELYEYCSDTHETMELHRQIAKISSNKRLERDELIVDTCPHEWGEYTVRFEQRLLGMMDFYRKTCSVCYDVESSSQPPSVAYIIKREPER